VVEFLTHLLRNIPGNVHIVWDRLAQHRSHLVRDFIAAQGGRAAVERLPAYAPELNPAEYIWGCLKDHEIPNLCPTNLWDLTDQPRRALRRMRRRPRLIRAFWVQASLFDECHYIM
jgi:transposase